MARVLNARELYASMRHAIGGSFSKELREQDLLNDALEQVASMHSWAFLDSGEAYLDLRGSVSFSGWDWTDPTVSDPLTSGALASYTRQPGDMLRVTAGGNAGYYKVASSTDDSLTLETSIATGVLSGTVGGTLEPRTVLLPDDFRELIDVGFDTDTSIIADVTVTSAQEVARFQRQILPTINRYYACAERVVLDTGEVRHLLRVAPTPTNALQSAMLAVYRRRIPEVSSDAGVVQVPEYLYVLVKQVARAWVRSLEMPKTWGSFERQLGEIEEGVTFKLARQADDGVGEEIGKLGGGHVGRRSSYMDGNYIGHNISIGGPVTP